MAIGGVTSGIGTGVYLDADAWEIDGEQKKYSLHETVTRQQTGIGLIASGVGGIVGGGALLLIGQLLKPQSRQYYKGMYRSHQKALEWEEQERSKPQTSAPQVPQTSDPQAHSPKVGVVVQF